MPLEELIQLLTARLFTPFRIHVSDGSHHDVLHPAQCMPLAQSLLVGVPGNNLPDLAWARYVNIALIHIAKLELLPPAPTTSGNGAASQ